MSFLNELSENKQAITLYKYNGNDIKVPDDTIIEAIDKSGTTHVIISKCDIVDRAKLFKFYKELTGLT